MLVSWARLISGRALVPMLLLAAILACGAATALAGKPILGDPLREPGRTGG